MLNYENGILASKDNETISVEEKVYNIGSWWLRIL